MADESLTGNVVNTKTGLLEMVRIEIDSGVIVSVTPAPDVVSREESTALTLVPGFIDLQVNGAGSVDVPTASVRDLELLCHSLELTGVAGWLPTVVTRPLDEYRDVLERIDEVMSAQLNGSVGGAEMLGVHLEGPFLGGRPGAHRRELIVAPTPALIEAMPPSVKLVTLGAETEGAVEATRALVERGVVVSIGHTAASVEQLDAVRHAGATLVTHLYNAMTGVHHRDEGVASWALTTDAMSTAIIADGHHVLQPAVSIALRCKAPNKVVAVTDTVAHLRDGLHGGGDGAPAHLADGTIAGGTADMALCFANLVSAGASIGGAVDATSTNPARLLGLVDRGAVGEGKRADLVGLNNAYDVQAVWRAGRRVR